MKMADGLCGLIKQGATFDCENKAIGGIEQRETVLFNRAHIDIENTVVERDSATNKHRITKLVLLPGTQAYSFQGIINKKVLTSSYSKEEGDYADTMKHGVSVMIYNQREESLVLLNQFLNGGDVVSIVEDKDKGVARESTYKIYGFENGLFASAIDYKSSEKNGFVELPLESKEPFEPYVPYVYFDTDFATTKASIEALKSA